MILSQVSRPVRRFKSAVNLLSRGSCPSQVLLSRSGSEAKEQGEWRDVRRFDKFVVLMHGFLSLDMLLPHSMQTLEN